MLASDRRNQAPKHRGVQQRCRTQYLCHDLPNAEAHNHFLVLPPSLPYKSSTCPLFSPLHTFSSLYAGLYLICEPRTNSRDAQCCEGLSAPRALADFAHSTFP